VRPVCSDPLTMVPCQRFDKAPALWHSLPPHEQKNAQPFTIHVKASVQLLIDFHSHLLNTEVIGFLGGTWDAVTRCTLFSSPLVLNISSRANPLCSDRGGGSISVQVLRGIGHRRHERGDRPSVGAGSGG
jgi:hypothetical protein